MKIITKAQIRAARALLRWSAQDLADASGIGIATIRRMEVLDGVPRGHVGTLVSIAFALEEAGVEFIGTPEENPGVRLRLSSKGS